MAEEIFEQMKLNGRRNANGSWSTAEREKKKSLKRFQISFDICKLRGERIKTKINQL